MDPGADPSGDAGLRAGRADSLHRSVADRLRRRLTTGHLRGGSKLPALREMADEFNVSTMTVRQAIRVLEREGHVYRIHGVGAFVRPRRPEQTGAARTVALIGGDLGSAFQLSVARGIQKACQQRGWALQLLDAHFDAALEERNIKRLPESSVAGAIILPPLSSPDTISALLHVQSPDFPMVLVDQTVPGLRADLVASDHEAGSCAGTRYLLAHGHTQPVMVTHPEATSSVAARVRGYRRALHDAGMEARPEWIGWIDEETHLEAYRKGCFWRGAREAALPLLRGLEPPIGVLAIDAYAGWGVYEACRTLGLSIPDDVSVIAFDDLEITHAISPTMTIIAQRTDQLGRGAVDLLAKRIEKGRVREGAPRAYTEVVVDVDLIERQSVSAVLADVAEPTAAPVPTVTRGRGDG